MGGRGVLALILYEWDEENNNQFVPKNPIVRSAKQKKTSVQIRMF
jgi:hypothetical protein